MSTFDARQLATASISEVGCVRSVNEDSCGEFDGPGGRKLLIVADGMGGHRGGATASATTVEAIGEVFQKSRADADPAGLLAEAVQVANAKVHRMSVENAELRGMGTTAVMILFDGDGTARVAHVGDSRAYRLRDGRMEPLTADHSVVGEMIRQGLISEEDGAVHPRRNEILRSVGVDAQVEADLGDLDLRAGDRYLLCSDGLSGLVSDEELGAVLQRESPHHAARTLVDTANQRGSPDNVTVQIAAVPGGVTTEIGATPDVVTQTLAAEHERRERARRVKIFAGVTAAVAGVLAAFLLWILLGSGLETEPQDERPATPREAR